jgi:hypothetical protein
MRKMLLLLMASLVSVTALAVPRVDCNACTTLREFGNFGAASLYRATGPAAPAVGSDQIWVDNRLTGKSVFVDLDTPIILHTIMGTEIPIPDLTQLEVNAIWADGSGRSVWVLPNAVLGAIGASIEAAENYESPEVTPEEVMVLPGLGDGAAWEGLDWYITNGGSGTLSSGGWVFVVTGSGGESAPIVMVVECLWWNFC